MAAETILSEGHLGNWEYDITTANTGVYARGFFKAPRTGVYNFWVAGDDKI